MEEEWAFWGAIEVGETYGTGAKANKPVGHLEKCPYLVPCKGGNVFTKVILDAKAQTLLPLLREKEPCPDSFAYTRSNNAKYALGFKHYRINHSTLFADSPIASNTCGIKPNDICE